MNLSILARCGLFRGIETAELSPLLRRLHACTREFDKFQPIYRSIFTPPESRMHSACAVSPTR